MKYLIAGTARNISHSWERVKQSLFQLFQLEYSCVIVESNSEDNTVQLLNDWASVTPNVTIITLGTLEGSRTQRIARCRNEYLKYLDGHDYMLVVDLDEILVLNSDFKQQLDSCFARSDWDAIASNRRKHYYDIWALRSRELGCVDDCWEKLKNPVFFLQTGKFIGTRLEPDWDKYLTRFKKNIPSTSHWIECQSAFGGMALYKVSSITGRKYDGNKTCEHVSFHTGLRMFINPNFMSG